MSPFAPMCHPRMANPKKEPIELSIGKYSYDVFYTFHGEMCVGFVKGDNKKDALLNAKYIYGGENIKIKFVQRLSY